MEIEFYGAAGEVTGSCHVLRVGGRSILLDCGLIQGGEEEEGRNRDPFPFKARDLDAVVLSHAHIDHCGRLPLLLRRGFHGPIFCQNATRDLARILLADSARLAEGDAKIETRKRLRRGLKAVTPLYTTRDATKTWRRMIGLRYGAWQLVAPDVRLRFHDAGHIMGSSIAELELRDNGAVRRLLFSGDLGQYDTPILRDPSTIADADLVLMECTYGDRRHRERSATLEQLRDLLTAPDADRGNILVPAFAVGRSQEILYLLGTHYREWGLERFRIFLDSPMAIEASEVYWKHPQLYDDEATRFRREHHEMPALPNLVLSRTPAASRRINGINRGAIVIAGSGMCTGGRILHHFKHNLWRAECQVLITGYQGRGSLGRRLVDGDSMVRVHGEELRVRAAVHTLGGLSAHGDSEDLLHWYKGVDGRPPVCLVHGEEVAARVFRTALLRAGAPWVEIARRGTRVDLRALRVLPEDLSR